MSNDSFQTPQPPAAGSSGGSNTAVIVGIVLAGCLAISLVCGGVLLALLLPAIQAARTAAQSMQASNNLKMVGLAVHNYHSAYRQLPAAAATDDAGQPIWSWRVTLLPFMEEQSRWQQWQQDQLWNSGANSPLLTPTPLSYGSPQESDANTDQTHVFAVRHPNGIMSGETDLTFADIKDGLARTLLAVYLPHRTTSWAAPEDISLAELQVEFSNATPKDSILVLFADGAVQRISAPLDPASVEALVTRDADDMASPF